MNDLLRVIPSDDIPNGFKRTVGNDIFVSSRNYEYMKPLSAKGTIILLGILIELDKSRDQMASEG